MPSTYTPGSAFTFAVRVPQLGDFAGFNVELIFSTNTPNPSLFVSSDAPEGPDGRYVFPTTATFQSGSSHVVDSSEIVLTFRDSTDSPVTSEMGLNDTIAIVTVRPGATFTGPITISLDFRTNFSINPESVTDGLPEPVTIPQADSGGPSPVPAPASGLLLGLGGLLLGVRKRLTLRNRS